MNDAIQGVRLRRDPACIYCDCGPDARWLWRDGHWVPEYPDAACPAHQRREPDALPAPHEPASVPPDGRAQTSEEA